MPSKFQPQLSLHLINLAPEGHTAGWGHLLALARACDAAGIDRVNVSDHVVFGEELEEYAKPEVGGREGGKQPTGPDGHWLEPMTTLAVIAGQTSRVRLGTQILLAALRRPVILAKSAATLDVLSGGRLDLGVGVGWQKAEYEAAGLPFERAGQAAGSYFGGLQDAVDRNPGVVFVTRSDIRWHSPDAEAIAARRRADLGQRHDSRHDRPAARPLWRALDSLGQG